MMILTEDGPYTPEITQGVVGAVIAVAAFGGLREGEIRGQWWEDYEEDILSSVPEKSSRCFSTSSSA
jgi:hypothetical protein